ncbi:hypothetical protein SAMN02745225_02149 [Ferrithrix thermotolerans DSM 19514]|jgi:hypothetical protein|uniref:Uncharacterized protein n=1 Tax=Ferrithrix thermotolerans DSM 19514 TaxID=1121881 RepID=A0A1M4XVC6_9ACTN|nr:hypothetical protein [Ferrithrix thermotolerans]SHE97380.1 hypothetical protein SAMN02745225_02149 [Ferrithrix thermotolerans DSM 19514]
MLDHILLDFVANLKSSLESSMLEKAGVEERFQIDVWLGDISFETSYSLPGEDNPPTVRADISLEWPTWSQSNFRSWTLGEGFEEGADINVEVAIRAQHRKNPLELNEYTSSLPASSPTMFATRFELTSISEETSYEPNSKEKENSIEFVYDATLHIDENLVEDQTALERELEPFGAWIASLLVRVSDLKLTR